MVVIRPTVVFIPGFWHTSEGFGPLAALLQRENYATTLIDLPSAGAHPSHPDYSQDVAAIRKIVTNLADAGEEVLLVMHSGGSIDGSDAVKDLSKKEREAEGKKGGVVSMFYIGILLPQAGKSIFETFQSVVTSPDLDPDFVIDLKQEFVVIAEDGTSTITDNDIRFYNDLPPEEAKYWSSKLTSLSLGAAMSPLVYQAWKHIPSTYVTCLNDKTIPLKQVREIVKNAEIMSISSFLDHCFLVQISHELISLWACLESREMVFEIDAGHCPYLSQPETVAGFIKEAAGK